MSTKKGAGSLNDKQKAFVQEYIVDFNATQAAIRAGYSEKTAGSQAFALLKKHEIEAGISEAIRVRESRTEITQDKVVKELAKIGFSDIRKAVTWGSAPYTNGATYPVELVNSNDIDDDTAAAISEVSLTSQGVKVKMADKLGALRELLRHTSDDSVNVTLNMPFEGFTIERAQPDTSKAD